MIGEMEPNQIVWNKSEVLVKREQNEEFNMINNLLGSAQFQEKNEQEVGKTKLGKKVECKIGEMAMDIDNETIKEENIEENVLMVVNEVNVKQKVKDKVYKCNLCEMNFKKGSSLRVHRKRKHTKFPRDESDEHKRNRTCDICFKVLT